MTTNNLSYETAVKDGMVPVSHLLAEYLRECLEEPLNGEPLARKGRRGRYTDEILRTALGIFKEIVAAKIQNIDWNLSQTGIAIGTKKAVAAEIMKALALHNK